MWGDDISEVRTAELESRLGAWEQETDHGARLGPFDGEPLTGADVLWLAARTLAGSVEGRELAEWAERLQSPQAGGEVTLYLLRALNLKGANLEHAQLARANLLGAQLERATFMGAHLEGANLWEAHLEGATFTSAHLEEAELWKARLEQTSFVAAHLQRANLWQAHLEQANLFGAHLERANLREAHLDGADLRGAQLQGANLWMSFLDRGTLLGGAMLADTEYGSARVADVHWGEVNLAVVDWSRVTVLGDEPVARYWQRKPQAPTPAPGMKSAKPARRERQQARREAHVKRLFAFVDAARAHRQLATALRAQGITDEADRFAYRAHLCQRSVYRLQRKVGRWFGSFLLDVTSGYGYRPGRSVMTYLLVVTLFGLAYWALGIQAGHPLTWNEAGVVSLTAFHGRGFFSTAFAPGDPEAALAAIEAVIGLLIEITFIATFTQRFFAR
jgi:hypothetical protein